MEIQVHPEEQQGPQGRADIEIEDDLLRVVAVLAQLDADRRRKGSAGRLGREFMPYAVRQLDLQFRICDFAVTTAVRALLVYLEYCQPAGRARSISRAYASLVNSFAWVDGCKILEVMAAMKRDYSTERRELGLDLRNPMLWSDLHVLLGRTEEAYMGRFAGYDWARGELLTERDTINAAIGTSNCPVEPLLRGWVFLRWLRFRDYERLESNSGNADPEELECLAGLQRRARQRVRPAIRCLLLMQKRLSFEEAG